VAGNTLDTSGCVAIDPRGGPNPEPIVDQTKLVLSNLNAILIAVGCQKTDFAKTTLF
jgi:enamine deaminase RidA (YjgF/YER057c/UK114 family)